MDSRTRQILISLAVVAVVGAAAWYFLAQQSRLPAESLDRVPEGTIALARLDIEGIRGSTWWERYVAGTGQDQPLRRLEERCGFDPLAQIQDLLIFVHGDTPTPLEHVGFVAEGDFDLEALGTCVRDAVAADTGGEIERTEIEGVPAIAPEHGESRAAFIGSRGIIAGHREVVARTIRTVRGFDPSVRADPMLSSMWESMPTDRDIVVVARLPETWQNVTQEVIGAERAQRILPHLRALEAVGVSARVERGLGLSIFLRMRGAVDAGRLAHSVEEAVERMKRNPLVALSPAGGVLNRLGTEARDSDVILAVDIDEERSRRMMDMIDELVGRATQAPSGPADLLRRAAAEASASRRREAEGGAEPAEGQEPSAPEHDEDGEEPTEPSSGPTKSGEPTKSGGGIPTATMGAEAE